MLRPVRPSVPLPFIERYASAFGKNQGLLLKLSGMLGAEVSADGAVVVDDSGKEWLDFGSFGVHLLGHRPESIVAAARDQLGLMGLSTKILGGAAATSLAEALLGITADSLNRVVFANSGAEATDIALKLAYNASDRREVVSLKHSYHGKTLGAMSVSDSMRNHQTVSFDHVVHFVDADDRDALRRRLETRQVAAVFMEPIQGEGGIRPVSPEYLAFARELCTKTNTMLVFDEIQTGLGRCGEIWRSASRVVPDALLVGKTLGGGLVPLSAVIFSTTVISDRMSDPVLLASTFAGGALASRIGIAVVDLISNQPFLDGVRQMGTRSMSLLRYGLESNAAVTDVRGEGLMIGIEVADPSIAGHAVIEAAAKGVLMTFCLHDPKVLRVYPPAVCSDDQLEIGLGVIVDGINIAAERVAGNASKGN